jgi:hypothetical protein
MDTVSPYEKRQELRRILNSRHFAKAEKKARFLEFVTEQALAGNAEKLNEFLIGLEIYERGEDFNPQTDPIVRVQAHQIRRLLCRYYEEEGKDSPIRLDLPPGHYIPRFTRLTLVTTNDEPQPVASATPSVFRMRNALVVLVCVAALLSFLWLGVFDSGSPSLIQNQQTRLPPEMEWFWGPFLPPAEPPLITIPVHPILRAAHEGDSPATWAHGRLIDKESLPEFRDTIHFRELDRFNFVPSTTDFTAVGETMGLVRLLDLFWRMGQTPQVRPARLVDFQSIKIRNTVLLGGNQAWSGRIFVFPENFHFYRGVIRNKNPKPGELSEYKPEFDPVTNHLSRDYGLILMLPNENREERVLLIYGIYTQGSQAGIEFVTMPDHLAELRQALAACSPDKQTVPQLFQALIETSVENGVPGRASLVSVRTFPERE